MNQKGVTRKALAIIKKEYQNILDDQKITPKKAFAMRANTIKGIAISGRTLRKIFTGEHVHVNTIESIIESLGKELVLNNGKIDIEDETNKTSIEGPTDGKTISKAGENESRKESVLPTIEIQNTNE